MSKPTSPIINKKNIQNTALILVSLIIVVGLSEITLRFYFGSKYGNTETICLQGDDKLIYRLKANSGQCRTNSKGYMDDEHPEKKSGKRIVIIGDSVANGHGVPFGKSFGKLLEKELNAASGSTNEVILLAVPGYSTSQEITLLKDEAFLYNPDLILIAYHVNDPAHPLYHNAGGQVGLYFRKPTSYALFYLQRLLFRAKGRLKGIQAGCPKKPWSLFLHCIYWLDVKESFREITTISKNNGTPVVFAFLPLLLDPAEAQGMDELFAKLGDLAKENGARSVNLMQPFQGYDMKSVRLPNDPWHPNEQGHQIIAETLFNYFQDKTVPAPDKAATLQAENKNH